MTHKKLRTWGDHRKEPLTGEPTPDLDADVQKALDAFFASGGKIPPKPKKKVDRSVHCGWEPCNRLFTPLCPGGVYCSPWCSRLAWNAKRRKGHQ